MMRSLRTLWRNADGAVAPTVALSLTALIAAGGIAFDYSRLASMDTELQNAADQAALAAASQLDGEPAACARAAAAARSLLINNTLFANENGGARAVTIPSEPGCDAVGQIKFYQSYNQLTDTPGLPATGDNNAKVVIVDVDPREAFYALTPVVAAFRSGAIPAQAVAALGRAACKVPPLMMCNPEETGGNLTFNPANYIGKGIQLVDGGQGALWAPGNFGFLQITKQPGKSVLEYALGANVPPEECIPSDSVTTETGQGTSTRDAINTRFDIYDSGLTNDCSGSLCSPALNTRKDVVHPQIASTPANDCKFKKNQWWLPAVQYEPGGPVPSAMGFPRDIIHAGSKSTTGRFGDGNWDRNMYFYVNHKSLYSPSAPDATWKSIPSLVQFANANGINLNNLTRYQAYLWEIDANQMGSYQEQGGTDFSYSRPQCATGVGPSSVQTDRRVATIAVVNCKDQDVGGKSTDVSVVKWVDAFLVEPSLDRKFTQKQDFYIEVIREAPGPSNANGSPIIRHDVPYLIK